jgi:hypothetical protein
MAYSLSPRDYQMLVETYDGDEEAARAALQARGYSLDGEEADTAAATPNMQGLSGILSGQRKSIGDLYDNITANIQKRYRAPDTNDLLVQIGMGMLAPQGENDAGGFAGSIQRGLRGVGAYAQSRRAYETDMNKMLADVETDKAKQLAALESRYLTSAATAMRPRIPKAVGTQVVNGKIVAVAQDPTTGEYSQTVLGDAPADLKPIPGRTSNNQPVFMGAKGPVDAMGNPVTQFDVKPKPISATEQRQTVETEDLVNSGIGAVKTLEEALGLNSQAYEGSLSGWRKSVGQLFGSDDPRYVATENFDNLITTSALQSLRAIFGGNPTEGERKILLDIQAVSSKPRAVREAILRRALDVTKRRIGLETQRLQRLKGGDYSTRGGSTAGAPRVIRYDKNGKRI